MRIFSKFKDYYDVMLAYDRDPSPVYARDTVVHDTNSDEFKALKLPIPRGVNLSIRGLYNEKGTERGTIFFCGKVYPFWGVNRTYCYNHRQIVTAVKASLEKYRNGSYARDLEEILQELYTGNVHSQWVNEKSMEMLDSELKNKPISDALHLAYKSPILIKIGTWLYVNPNLREYGFQACLDPHTAYQELSMFMGNNLAQQNEPPSKQTDELKVHAHGFDRWSFRTHKEDGRKARKERQKQSERAVTVKDQPLVGSDDFRFETE